MYAEPEVLIKLSAIEIQQALAIELDRDSSQALQFMKEKIVDKYFRAPCSDCWKSYFAKGASPWSGRVFKFRRFFGGWECLSVSS
jgi:hypothetical protein